MIPRSTTDEVRRKWWGIDITHDDGRREHIDTWNTRTEQRRLSSAGRGFWPVASRGRAG